MGRNYCGNFGLEIMLIFFRTLKRFIDYLFISAKETQVHWMVYYIFAKTVDHSFTPSTQLLASNLGQRYIFRGQ